MQALINASLKHRFLVLVAWLLLIVLGIRAMLLLPIDAVPDVTNVQVQVLTNAPGLSPEDVERFITFPVESAMGGIPKVEEIRSVSKFGLSVVTVVFLEGTDIYWARQQIGERLGEAREWIPSGYGQPEMGPISTGLGEIYQFEVRGEGFSPMELRSILDGTINYQLRSVPGVVEVNAFGGELKTYRIAPDPQKLMVYQVSLAELFAAVEANHRNVGGGYIAHQGEQYLIRGEGLVSSLDDLANIIVRYNRDTGVPIFVRDLADVDFAPMIRQGAVTRDGRGEAVIGIVMMLLGENSRTVSERVHEKVQQIQKSLPDGVVIDTFYNRTELVDRTIRTVAWNLSEGALLVVLILLLLLGSLRASLLVALSIPLSMLVAFIGMRAFGISGNLMSLGAVDFGLMVDGSVVVIENVMRRMQGADARLSPLERMRVACGEMARPVVFAVSIYILVYVPILALSGIEGKMFKPMAFTLIFALAGSLLCALTLMPVLASFFLQRPRERKTWLFRICERLYVPLLDWCMARARLVFAAAVAFFVASLSVIWMLGAEFMPQLDEGSIAMQVWRLPSISLEQSNRISTQVERVLKAQFPEVDTVISRTGRAEIATDPMGVEISDVYLMLTPPETWRFDSKAELVAAIEEALHASVAGAMFSFSQPIQLRVAELISGVRSDVAVKLYGDDLQLLKAKADEVVALLRGIEGAADVKAEQIVGLPTLRVKLNREALGRFGVNAQDVLDVVETLGGRSVGVVFEGQNRYEIRVRFDEDVRRSPEAVGDLLVAVPDGRGTLLPLSQLADVVVEDGPAQISRDQFSRRISVELNVRGRDLAGFVAEAQAVLDARLDLPDGWFVRWGGQFENLTAASQRLALLVPLTLVLIFVMLYTTFGSGRLAALIFCNVPLAVSGGLVMLALRDFPFSISAGVGFIALCGIAVLNGVVLVSTIEALRQSGMEAVAAAREGAKLRLRPVLMTAITAAIGFLPMALATSAGAEVQRPLATVVIGGVMSALVLTLVVIPSIYAWFLRGRG